MPSISSTRQELLARRARIRLASQARDLLREKQRALLGELRAAAEAVVRRGEALDRAAALGRSRLARADALLGPEPVRSAASAASGERFVRARRIRVMGLPLVEIEHTSVRRAPTRRGYGLPGSSAEVDDVAAAFESVLDLALEVAASELRVRRLEAEVRKTTRRVNALEVVLLPRLESERRHIARVLDERAREDQFRLHRRRGRRESS